jgi:glycosyltransferase involved in cell wall biosynthesis
MKVLAVNKYYQLTGGGDRFFFDTEHILRDNGHDVVPFCLDYVGNRDTPFRPFFPAGVRGVDTESESILGKAKLFINGIYSFEARRALGRMLDEVPVDIAHLHILHYAMSPSVIDALDRHRVPIVFSLHDFRIVCSGGFLYCQGAPCQRCKGGNHSFAIIHRCYRGSTLSSAMGAIGNYLCALRKIYDKVDIFTVPHQAMLELLVEFGVRRDKLRVLQNPLVFRGSLPTSRLGDKVLYFGNLTRPKGVFTLLQAAGELPDIPFLFCGRGPAFDEMRKLVRDTQMRNVTIDTETRWENGLPETIASARLIVSPSEWPTPLEYTTLEAMALGKTVIASAIGGNREVIQSGVNGLLFAPSDAADLRRKLTSIYGEFDRITEIGARARSSVADNFSPQSFYENLLRVYCDAKEARATRDCQ